MLWECIKAERARPGGLVLNLVAGPPSQDFHLPGDRPQVGAYERESREMSQQLLGDDLRQVGDIW